MLAPSPNTLTEKDAATYIGMSAAWLRKARARLISTPPPNYVRCGRAIRYTRAALDNWLEARTVRSTRRDADAR